MKKMISINLYKKSRLEYQYNNIKSIYQNNTYLFKLDDIKTTINNKNFTRENKEYKFTLDIINKESTYYLKENNILIDIDVENLTYNEQNNSIILEYKLSSDEEEIKIELIVEGEIDE